MRWGRLEVRDHEGGYPLDRSELRGADTSGTAQVLRLPRRGDALDGQVGVMLASGRVTNSDFSGSRVPPASVPSNAKAPSTACESSSFEVLKGLGRRLAVRREQRGMTRQELADCVNYPVKGVSDVEHGLKPGPRVFWALADRALGADGSLLGDADRCLLIWAAAMQDELSQHHHAARKAAGPGRAMPSRAPVVDRVFANDLGAISVQGQRPSRLLATVERCRPRTERELAALTDAVRLLIRRTDFADLEIFAVVWQVLLRQDPREAALLSAVAVVELARARLQSTVRF